MAAVVITDYAEMFSRAWPAVSAKLRARLLRRGVPEAVVDDVLQDTALAALAREVGFGTEDDLLAWTTTVGRRLAIAEYRRRARVAPVDEVPCRALPAVDDEVIARLAADSVLRAIPQLSPADQSALGSTDAGSRTEAVRDNVRRHRARARLRAIAGAAWGAMVAAVARLRDTSATTIAVMSAAAITLTALGLPFAHHPNNTAPHAHDRMAVVQPPRPARTPFEARMAHGAPSSEPVRAPRDDAPRAERREEPRDALPAGEMAVPTPTGYDARVGGKADAPPAISLCTSTGPRTRQCIAIPVPPTPLDDL